MTYKKLQEIIENICLSMPNVRTFGVGDVYLLNSVTPDYIVTWLSLVNRRDYRTMTYFNINLFYVDRLKKDLSNEEMVINEGIKCLERVISEIKRTEGIYWDDTYAVVYTPFRERFSDECGGCYANLTVPVVLEEPCE